MVSDATIDFELKMALTSTPILALPDFSQPLIVECDVSNKGIGAFLHQDDRPISFYSHTLAQCHQKSPACEKELMGLIKAVRTNHYRIKYFLGLTIGALISEDNHLSYALITIESSISGTMHHNSFVETLSL